MSEQRYCSPQDFKNSESDIYDILCDVEFVKKNQKIQYANVASVFDIEATSLYKGDEKMCCMYAWVLGLNGRTYIGRTWVEFIVSIEKIVKYYSLSLEKRLIIYIHNLSYEFQWFRHYFEWADVFSTDTRKPLYAITVDGIEFRCSYLLSGFALEKLGKNLTKYKVNKKVGDLDYSLIRHSKTELTELEIGYINSDALVVMAHIQEEIERLGNIVEIPLTKTGYVRNLCRNRCLSDENAYKYRALMRTLTLSVDNYKQLKRAFTGGFTHANINFVNRTIKNVHSYDFTSSYPAVMLSEKYPMSRPYRALIKNEDDFIRHLKTFCCMFECRFFNLRSKVSFENYISISRCISAEHYILNNGRVVEADVVELTLTEQDFFIITKLYNFDSFEISNFNFFYKGYLPKELVLSVLELYQNKTELKDVEGEEASYMILKGMLNSCYGMCVTNPCKDDVIYDECWGIKHNDIGFLIDKYNKNYNRVLYYPWGVWITAYARSNLFNGILEFKDDYIYSDTDSIKVINIENHKDYFIKYNERITKKIERCLMFYSIDPKRAQPKTIENVVKPLGVWDYEGQYSRFKTLGAKRYIYEKNNDIHITVAGVGKKAGVEYLKHRFKTNTAIFENFKEDLYFPAFYEKNGKKENGSGKLCHTYIDYYQEDVITDYNGVEYVFNEQSGVHMENTDYTMSIDGYFRDLFTTGGKGNYIT